MYPWICSHYSKRIPWYSFQVCIPYILSHGPSEVLVELSQYFLMLGELYIWCELIFCFIAHPCWWSHELVLELVECSIDTDSPFILQFLMLLPCLSYCAKQALSHMKMQLYIPCPPRQRWRKYLFSYHTQSTSVKCNMSLDSSWSEVAPYPFTM